MNSQLNYIIQGFLLAFLFPIGVFEVNKISSIKPTQEETDVVIDFETSPKINEAQIHHIKENLFLYKNSQLVIIIIKTVLVRPW